MRLTLCPVAALALTGALGAQTSGSWMTSGFGCPGPGALILNKANINAGDDAVNGPHALGFSFPYVGGVGTTDMIDIAPNGYIYFEAGTNSSSRCCNGIAAGTTPPAPIADFLTAATPSVACFGQDLNANAGGPGGAGAVYFGTNNVDEACVVWECVGEYNQPGSSNLLSCTMRLDGSITVEHFDCSLLSHSGLVGYSPGNNATARGHEICRPVSRWA